MKRPDWDAFAAARAESKANPSDKKLARKAFLLREKLIEDNMGLVKTFVLRLHKASTQYSEIEDLMQAGAMGLSRALETFDPEHAKFSTYAFHWIRHEVQNAMSKQAQIYRPRNSGMPLAISVRADKFRRQHGREPTPEDLGTVGPKPVTQADLDKWAAFPLLTSIDEPRGKRAGTDSGASGVDHTLHDFIPDGNDGPEEVLIRRQTLARAMNALTEIERDVVLRHYRDGQWDRQIARELGYSEEGIRQIKIAATSKLGKALAAEEAEDDE